MNRIRMLVVMGVALGLALVVTVLAYRTISERLKPVDDKVAVVVVNQRVALGDKLTAADMRVVSWPKSIQLPGLLHDPVEAIGRGVVTPMETNEPVLESKLAPKNGGAGLMTTIPEGMRAVSVKVNDVIGVAGFVVPGSRVDVILTASQSGATDMATTVLQNVEVLAAGQTVNRDFDGKPVNAQVITLLVTPEESEKLALVTADGRIQLALRNPLDKDVVNSRPVQRAELYTGFAAAPKVEVFKAPAPPQPPATRVVAPKAASKPAREAVAAPAPTIPPATVAPAACSAEKVEVQLIQGAASQVIKFEKKAAKDQPCA